ncbi:MAG: uroporphyrinogen decarboxylase family protein [Candidatus Rokubacteria bacterium]|nr:uroporphyrinogen decarboxylase family protein [Candidatus Rokubacteria bacterium]
MALASMSPMDRIMAVCHHEIPDRVPFLLTSREFGLRYAGVKHSKAYEDPEIYIGAQLKLLKDFQLDGVWDIWCTPAVDEALGATMEIPDDDPPWITRPCVHGPADLEKLKPVNPWRDGRMPYLLDVIARLKKAVGPDVPVIAWASPPFRTACMIRGNTELYMDIYDNPQFVKNLLEFTTETCTAYGKALVEAGADIIATSNPVANMDCISLDHFKEFAHPYSKRMFAALKDAGAKAINFHTCGRWDDRYELCVENADIIHCDRVDLGEFKAKYSNKVVTMGNVKSVATLLQGTSEQVAAEALQCMAAAPGGRYIFSSDCAVPRDPPPANVRAMANVREEVGAYPV